MANDTIWNYVNDFLTGRISRKQFWVLAEFKYPIHQISFHTLSALNCLTFERSEVVYDGKRNDFFYVCSLIEYIGRQTKNKRGVIAKALGKKGIEKQLYDAEVNHCLSFEQVGDEVVEEYKIPEGSFDTITACNYTVPGFMDIGKLYSIMIEDCAEPGKEVDELIKIFSSFISEKISDFNSDIYYQNPSYLECSYQAGCLLD